MVALIPYGGRTIAVLGLGKSGLAAARALTGAGADVWAWDDDPAKRQVAAEEGLKLVDLRDSPGDRLFHNHVFACLETRYCHTNMLLRRREDVDGFYAVRAAPAHTNAGRDSSTGLTLFPSACTVYSRARERVGLGGISYLSADGPGCQTQS